MPYVTPFEEGVWVVAARLDHTITQDGRDPYGYLFYQSGVAKGASEAVLALVPYIMRKRQSARVDGSRDG
jgi:hypothetical protein